MSKFHLGLNISIKLNNMLIDAFVLFFRLQISFGTNICLLHLGPAAVALEILLLFSDYVNWNRKRFFPSGKVNPLLT